MALFLGSLVFTAVSLPYSLPYHFSVVIVFIFKERIHSSHPALLTDSESNSISFRREILPFHKCHRHLTVFIYVWNQSSYFQCWSIRKFNEFSLQSKIQFSIYWKLENQLIQSDSNNWHSICREKIRYICKRHFPFSFIKFVFPLIIIRTGLY